MGAPQGSDPLTSGGSLGAVPGRPSLAFFTERLGPWSRAGRALCYGAIAMGVALRLAQLLANRSMSQDESMLALNILHRSFGGLFRRLDFLQGAPVAFLELQKVVVESVGKDELALRLLPFVAGTVAVLLILYLARLAVAPAAVPIVVVLFAASDPLIDWTTVAKPYALDVLLSVVLLWSGVSVLRSPDSPAVLVIFAVVSTLAIWISNPSVFTLAGISAGLIGGAVLRKEWRRAARFLAASLGWVASFVTFALTLLHNLSGLQDLECATCFGAGRSGVSGGSSASSELHSLRASLGEFRYASGVPHFLDRGSNDVGLLVFVLALCFCIIGLYSLARKRRELVVMLVVPLILMLIAWALHNYPTLGRTQLFLTPSFLLAFGEGVVTAVRTASLAAARTVLAVCGGVVVVAIVAPSIQHLVKPRHYEEIKPALNHLSRLERAGDTVFVYYTAQYALAYYLDCRCAGRDFEKAQASGMWPERRGPGGPEAYSSALLSVPPRLVIPRFRGSSPLNYVSDFDVLRGRKRVWFLLSNIDDLRRSTLLDELSKRGTLKSSFKVGRANQAVVDVYLFDMSERDA